MFWKKGGSEEGIKPGGMRPLGIAKVLGKGGIVNCGNVGVGVAVDCGRGAAFGFGVVGARGTGSGGGGGAVIVAKGASGAMRAGPPVRAPASTG